MAQFARSRMMGRFAIRRSGTQSIRPASPDARIAMLDPETGGDASQRE
ncbi:hypothetical protein [Rhodopseudomonas palustris]|nr:hypothetical protein [Rhodopseudomonas palustris]